MLKLPQIRKFSSLLSSNLRLEISGINDYPEFRAYFRNYAHIWHTYGRHMAHILGIDFDPNVYLQSREKAQTADILPD